MDRQIVGDTVINAADAMEKPRCWPRLGGFVLGLALGFSLAIEIASRNPIIVDYDMFIHMGALVMYLLGFMLMRPVRRSCKPETEVS